MFLFGFLDRLRKLEIHGLSAHLDGCVKGGSLFDDI